MRGGIGTPCPVFKLFHATSDKPLNKQLNIVENPTGQPSRSNPPTRTQSADQIEDVSNGSGIPAFQADHKNKKATKEGEALMRKRGMNAFLKQDSGQPSYRSFRMGNSIFGDGHRSNRSDDGYSGSSF
jgi:hypothetical protein